MLGGRVLDHLWCLPISRVYIPGMRSFYLVRYNWTDTWSTSCFPEMEAIKTLQSQYSDHQSQLGNDLTWFSASSSHTLIEVRNRLMIISFASGSCWNRGNFIYANISVVPSCITLHPLLLLYPFDLCTPTSATAHWSPCPTNYTQEEQENHDSITNIFTGVITKTTACEYIITPSITIITISASITHTNRNTSRTKDTIRSKVRRNKHYTRSIPLFKRTIKRKRCLPKRWIKIPSANHANL